MQDSISFDHSSFAHLPGSPGSAVSLHLAQIAQEADARFHALMDISHNGVCITTAKDFLYVNAAFAEMLGYAREELIGHPCRPVVDERDVELFESMFARAGMGKPVEHDGIVHFQTKNGIDMRAVHVRAAMTIYAGRKAYLLTFHDFTDLRRGEMALHDYARRLRRLSQQVLDVQENERRHLARELHDEIGQQLTLVKLSLHGLEKQQGAKSNLLAEALDHVTSLLSQVRNLSLDLRPSMLDDLGLAPALRWYAGRAAALADIALTLEIDADFPPLRSEIETLFFRIAQEAVTNVLRHAAATAVRIELTATADQAALTIADNGRGFSAEAAEHAMHGGSSGLLGMRERAALGGAELSLDSSPDKGTTLRLVLPLLCAETQSIYA